MSNSDKRAAMLSLLDTGRMVRVLFATDTPGVDVPAWVKEQPVNALDFGRRAPTPIEDLVCDAGGISATLRFGGDYHWCSIPWEAVVGIAPHGPTPAQRAWNPAVLDGGKN